MKPQRKPKPNATWTSSQLLVLHFTCLATENVQAASYSANGYISRYGNSNKVLLRRLRMAAVCDYFPIEGRFWVQYGVCCSYISRLVFLVFGFLFYSGFLSCFGFFFRIQRCIFAFFPSGVASLVVSSSGFCSFSGASCFYLGAFCADVGFGLVACLFLFMLLYSSARVELAAVTLSVIYTGSASSFTFLIPHARVGAHGHFHHIIHGDLPRPYFPVQLCPFARSLRHARRAPGGFLRSRPALPRTALLPSACAPPPLLQVLFICRPFALPAWP